MWIGVHVWRKKLCTRIPRAGIGQLDFIAGDPTWLWRAMLDSKDIAIDGLDGSQNFTTVETDEVCDYCTSQSLPLLASTLCW